MTAERTVTVSLADRAYDVVIGTGLLHGIGERVRALVPGVRRALIVVDSHLPPHHGKVAERALEGEGIDATSVMIHSSEKHKNLQTFADILNTCASRRLERTDVIVALGGGVVGDVAGFAAACYRRGLPIVQCPTTLLAMVDASVGGKTGVNLIVPDPEHGPTLVKNMAGAFWQPRLVLADIDTLASLPQRQYRSGLAECIKHALLSGSVDADLLAFTEASLADALAVRPEVVGQLVARNVAVKARVVEGDEREEASDSEGGRAVLNLGHTFAHAVETCPSAYPDGRPEDSPLLHGEAVGLGLIAASRMSEAMDFFNGPTAENVERIVAEAGLPTRCAGVPDAESLLRTMRHDKKARAGSMRFIVPVAHGECRVIADPPDYAIRAGLTAIRAGG